RRTRRKSADSQAVYRHATGVRDSLGGSRSIHLSYRGRVPAGCALRWAGETRRPRDPRPCRARGGGHGPRRDPRLRRPREGPSSQTFSFDVVRKNGVDKRVKNVVIDRIAVDCDEGHERITPPPEAGSATIDSSGRFSLVGSYTRFSGRVEGSSAHGTMLVHGAFSGSSQNCDAGPVDWT